MDKVIPFKGIRKIIAERMRLSMDTAVQANHRIRADVGSLMQLRQKHNESRTRKLSLTDFLVKAVTVTLRGHPIMNSSLTGEGIVLHEAIHIGVAVATDRGLVVPVITDCGAKSVEEIGEKFADLAERARNHKLLPDEMSGGTFTLSNLGMYGIESFTAVINPPEAAILGVGAAIPTAIVAADGTIAARPMLELSLTYDHRIVDGGPAALFLTDLKKHLENVDFLP